MKWRVVVRPAILAALVVLLAIYGTFIYRYNLQFHYEPTGDELYDRFAKLVLGEFRSRGFGLTTPGDGGFVNTQWEYAEKPINFDRLKYWEDEFQDDPRYPDLLVICGLYSLFVTNSETQETYCRESVRERILAGEYSEGYTWLFHETLPHFVNLTSRDDDLLIDFTSMAIAENPRNSYWYYRQADNYMFLGETELAWEFVRKGNEAAENNCIAPFPLSTLSDDAYRSEATGNLIVQGVVAQLGYENRPEHIRTRDRYKEVCICTALGFPLEMAEDWLIRARREGQMRGGNLRRLTSSTANAQILVNYFGYEWSVLPNMSTDEFLAIMHELAMALADPRIGPSGDLYESLGLRHTRFYKARCNKPPKSPLDQFIRRYIPHWCERFPGRTAQDWISLGIEARSQFVAAQEMGAKLDILDPPPFARWAGE